MGGFIWKYLKKYWLFALLGPLFMMGEAFMDLLQPRLMSIIVDEGILGLSDGQAGGLRRILTMGLQMMGCVIVGAFLGFFSGVVGNICAQNFGNDMRKDAFRNIMHFSFAQTEGFSTGSLVTRMTNDISQLQQLVGHVLRGAVRTLVLFLGGIVSLLMLNVRFGVVVAVSLPFVAAILFFFLRKANPVFAKLQEKLDRVNNILQENVAGIRVVKACVQEAYEERRFGEANGSLTDTQLHILLLFSYMMPLMNIILNISVVAVIQIGSLEVQAGSASPGTVMAAITYITQILNAVLRVVMLFQSLARGMASGQRVKEMIDCVPGICDGTGAKKTGISGKIEFRNVSFSYNGDGREPILKGINLVIEPGEAIGILGATGCGKSTLVQMIPRFYEVTDGCILVDDVDVKAYPLEELRQKIAFVFQKSEIFHDTIAGNLKWGKELASDHELQKAADVSQAAEFIRAKSEGMETMVSQSGNSLSGGQKQRLAIGRAVLKQAEILIFDDASSALDLKTEARLYREVQQRQPDTTKIIIAQRIASVRNADRIILLDNGRISACGTHGELMACSELYRDIYHSQMKGGE